MSDFFYYQDDYYVFDCAAKYLARFNTDGRRAGCGRRVQLERDDLARLRNRLPRRGRWLEVFNSDA